MARSDEYRSALLTALNDGEFRDFVVSALGNLEPNLLTNLNAKTHISEALLLQLFPKTSAEYLDGRDFQEFEIQIPPEEAERLAQSIVSRILADLLWWNQHKQAGKDTSDAPHFHYLFWNPEQN
jgi:hypothetical protein